MGEPHILSAAAALPENYVDQETLLAAFRAHWARKHFNLDRLEQLHRSVRVGGRHLALPLERYAPPEEFAHYRTYGLSLGFRQVASGPLVRSSYHADEQAGATLHIG